MTSSTSDLPRSARRPRARQIIIAAIAGTSGMKLVVSNPKPGHAATTTTANAARFRPIDDTSRS